MEVICPSETSGDFQWTARRYIPENIKLYEKIIIQKQCNKETATQGEHDKTGFNNL
jgi:hypothetical protein